MAANRFFKIDFAIAIGLFDAALDDPILVAVAVHAHFAFDGRRYPAEVFIILVPAVLLYPANSFFGEIRFNCFVDVVDDLELFLFKCRLRSNRLCISSGRKQIEPELPHH